MSENAHDREHDHDHEHETPETVWTPFEVPRVQVIDNHHGEGNARHEDDYPYGHVLRCQRRVWVHTATSGQGLGRQRMMSRTLDPKTGKWNNPKASTYTEMVILFLDPATGYVAYHGIGAYLRPAYDARLRLDGTLDQLTEGRRRDYENRRAMAMSATPSDWRRWERVVAWMAEHIRTTCEVPGPDDPARPDQFRGEYVSAEDFPWAVADALARFRASQCATIGCRRPATHAVTYTVRGQRDEPETERVCQPCGEGYVRRPALCASLAPLD